MRQNLFVLLVVGLRAIALWLVASSAFMLVVSLAVEPGLTRWPVALMQSGAPIVGGVVLWLIAKPLGTLLTRDLG